MNEHTAEKDVLPDGRIDHRGHNRDVAWDGWGWACLDCSTEEAEVPWTIPYNANGRPMREDWRNCSDAEVRALCGMVPALPAGQATEEARRLKSRVEAAEAKVDEVLRRIGRNLAQQHMAAERHQRAGLDDRHHYSEYHRMTQGRWAFYESARLLCQETRRDFDAFLSEHDPRHEEYDR